MEQGSGAGSAGRDGEGAGAVSFRAAVRDDVDAIVGMLADDMLGRTRERYTRPLPAAYFEAFEAIDADPNISLIVACRDGEVVGVVQLTLTPTLSYQGGWHATIEGVRTSSPVRGQGIGSALIRHAIGLAEARGCHLVQLMTDKRREDAKRFYERLGFQATHEGMKLHLRRPG
ncbi:MAG TPA: GNAT family N-acetyltransferase [Longimicrobiales bacterium]